MNKHTITIGDSSYIIDLDRAQELGICTKKQSITSFEVGDVFETPSGLVRILIIECNCGTPSNETLYQFAGRDGLSAYSDHDNPISYDKMLEYLNSRGYTFVCNINDSIAELLHSI
jgi:hypothetical protein